MDVKKISIALTLALLAAGSWWLSERISGTSERFGGAPRHEPDYIVENFHATVLDKQGRRRYVLSARRLTHYADDGSSEMEQPELVQYGDGAPVHARAANGWLPKDRSNLVLSGAVRVTRGRDARGAGGEITAERMNIRLDR